jgi:hypothetical protein
VLSPAASQTMNAIAVQIPQTTSANSALSISVDASNASRWSAKEMSKAPYPASPSIAKWALGCLLLNAKTTFILFPFLSPKHEAPYHASQADAMPAHEILYEIELALWQECWARAR